MIDTMQPEPPAAKDHEELRVAVGAVLFNVLNFPERAQTSMLGQDMTPLREKIVSAVLAAGYRLRYRDITDAQVVAARDWLTWIPSDRVLRAALEAARRASESEG